MDYQLDDITITNIDPQTDFNLTDFTNRFTSIQDYINGTRTKVNDLNSNKVDKVPNYGLSKNDFTDSYKDKLDNLYSASNTSKNGHTHLYAGSSTAGGAASGSEKIKTTQTSSNANFQIPFVNNVTSEQKTLYTDNTNGHLSYNPSTNTLTATRFSGIATYASNIGNASENISYSQLVSIIEGLTMEGKIEFRTINGTTYEVYSRTGIASSMTNTTGGTYVLSGYKLVGEPTIVQDRPENGSHILTITVTSSSPFTISVSRNGQGWENNNHAYIEFRVTKI